MDTPFWWTVCFVPGKRKPYIFSKFNPLNADSPLIPTNGVWLFRLSRFGGREEVSAHDSRALSLSNSFLLAWVAMFNDLLSRFSKAREIKWSGFLKTKGIYITEEKKYHIVCTQWVKIRIFVTYRIKERVQFSMKCCSSSISWVTRCNRQSSEAENRGWDWVETLKIFNIH